MRKWLAAILLLFTSSVVRAEALRVSAAISLRETLNDIIQSQPAPIELNVGASGQLLTQIRAGAPIDLFISASPKEPDALIADHLADPASRRVVAQNELVLIVPPNSTAIHSFGDLPQITRISLGEPRTVPAGAYAVQTLQSLKLIDKLQPHLVYAANVRQVLDYVQRGEVDAGIVYKTDALEARGGVKIVANADPKTHSPIEYVAVIPLASKNRPAAEKFLNYLASANAAKIFAEHGFNGGVAAPSHLSPSHSLLNPLILSLEISIAGVVLVGLVGIPLAYILARSRFPGRSVIEAITMVPLVLPPTVVGYLLIVAVGTQSPLGAWLRQHFHYAILFRPEAAILAAAIVALPLLLLPAKAAFATVESEMEDTARLMGASRLGVFWHVALPLARRGLASGLLLAFARALGEFGATIMVFGDIKGRRTLPIEIYTDYVAGEMNKAAPAVILLAAASLVIIALYNRSPLGRSN